MVDAQKTSLGAAPLARMRAERSDETTPVVSAQPIALRIPDAVAASGLSRTTLYAEMDDGKLAFVKVGSRRLILRDDLVAFLLERRVVAA